MSEKTQKIIGWITYITSLALVCFWMYWGINEAFHEGWYFISLWNNLRLTFIQYLSVPCILIILFLLAMRYKRIGSILFIATAIFAFFFFSTNAGRVLIALPVLLFALGYYFGNFQYKKWLALILILTAILIALVFGIPQYLRVESRYNDFDFGTRTVNGNGVTLVWAPQGIGFPLTGGSWDEAEDVCARLNSEGTGLESQSINIWRLPTRDELARSMTKKNLNAGGILDNSGKTQYKITPDKETPLWNPNSQVIYYWTSELASEKTAYFLAYNGGVWARRKDVGAKYQGYRCVKDLKDR
ncbi:MAG: DUF1566 domain-containing protein [Candidatus Paceibacterota bacterium]